MTNNEVKKIKETSIELKVKISDNKIFNGDKYLSCCEGEFDTCRPSECKKFKLINHFDYKNSPNNTSIIYCEEKILGWQHSFE